jgi:hypothetical protein
VTWPAAHHAFVQAALGEVVGGIALARGEGVARGVLEQPAAGQPRRRARVQRDALFRGARRGARAQHVARERVHAQPFAALARGEDRRLAREPREALGGVVRSRERVAELRMQVIDERDARQERGVVGPQVRDQEIHEAAVHLALARRHRLDQRGRVGAARDRRQRQLQTQRPALGLLVQARRGVRVDALPEALARERQRLLEREAQRLGADHRALPVGDEVGHAKLALGARGDHDAQVRRRVVHRVRQRLARRIGQPVRVLDDEHDVHRRQRHLREPHRDALERGRDRALDQRVPERLRPDPARTASASPARSARDCRRPATTARPPPRRATDARSAIAPAARSCRTRPRPAPRSPSNRGTAAHPRASVDAPAGPGAHAAA